MQIINVEEIESTRQVICRQRSVGDIDSWNAKIVEIRCMVAVMIPCRITTIRIKIP